MTGRHLPARASCVALLSCSEAPETEASYDISCDISNDIVAYGGTSAGTAAAIQAARMGRSVAIVGPEVHLGVL